jgi:hypothetical protein
MTTARIAAPSSAFTERELCGVRDISIHCDVSEVHRTRSGAGFDPLLGNVDPLRFVPDRKRIPSPGILTALPLHGKANRLGFTRSAWIEDELGTDPSVR